MRYWLIIITLCLLGCSTATVSPSVVPTINATAVPSETIVPLAETAMPTEAAAITTPIVVQCPDAPEIRLIIQERGRVTDDNNETLNLRGGPSISYDIIIALSPSAEFFVLDGPTCSDGFAWFRVRYRDQTGWLAEGDIDLYYVEPYLTG